MGLAVAGTGGSAGAALRPAVTTRRRSRPWPGAWPPSPATHRGDRRACQLPQRLTIQLWLQPRTAAATLFAQAVSTPGNPQFHHYLSPDAYAARFGATPAAARAVQSWLRAKGFTGVSISR